MRIALATLEAAVSQLNRELGRPSEPYTMRPDGQLKANIGNFHLSGAYGGWAVHEMVSEGGGMTHACGTYGYAPKREVYDHVHATLAGIRYGKEQVTVTQQQPRS